MNAKNKRDFVVSIQTPLQRLVYREWNGNDITAYVAVKSGGDNKPFFPANWSLAHDEPAGSCGGCLFRFYAGESHSGLAVQNPHVGRGYSKGPQASEEREYAHGLKAVRLVAKRLRQLQAQRGHSRDVAEDFGRWCEAVGVTQVWIARSKGSLLSEQEWEILSIGDAVTTLRRCLPETSVATPATEVAS